MSFNIIVTAKQVIDPEAPISSYRLDKESKSLLPDPAKNIPPVVNGFDENAVEAALRIKDSIEDVKVIVVSAGASFAMDVMKKVLSMGCDELLLVQDDLLKDVTDSMAIAKVISAAIKKIGPFDIIISGRQASDWDNAQIPLGIAELLELPCVPVTRKVEVADGKLVCEQIIPGGYQIVSAPMPAVVTVSNELGMPRYPTLRNIMAAARKQPEIIDLESLGVSPESLSPKVKIVDLYVPQSSSECELIEGDEEDAGRKLALKLREAKLI